MKGKTYGFNTAWNPTPATARVLINVQDILEENKDELPLTIRQIFYQLVAGYDFEKTERSYNRLIDYLSAARRAKIIPFDAIRDDKFYSTNLNTYESAEDWITAAEARINSLKVDRQIGQPHRTFLWVEARGIVPTVESLAKRYSITTASSQGFDSLTAKHRFASSLVESGENVRILHIGDHDPSGVTLAKALEKDVLEFARGMARSSFSYKFRRLAITAQQIDEYDIITAPAKKSSHSKTFRGETAQLEALKPAQLRSIIETAIEDELDQSALDKRIALEEEIKASLRAKLEVGE